MSHTLGARQAQKQKTRQAFLDAALALLEEQSLSSLGLREVTRAVGVAPTAFYRHFRSIPDLGVALVDEALGSLHPMVRETVSTTGDSEERISRAVELIAHYVAAHPRTSASSPASGTAGCSRCARPSAVNWPGSPRR